MTLGGTLPVSNFRRSFFALRIESSANLIVLDLPLQRDSYYQPRAQFWKKFKWTRQLSFTKFKRNKQMGNRKPFAFNKVSWSTAVSIEFFEQVDVHKINPITQKSYTLKERRRN